MLNHLGCMVTATLKVHNVPKLYFSFSLFPFKHYNQYSTCDHVQTDDLYNTHYRCTDSVHLNYTIHM